MLAERDTKEGQKQPWKRVVVEGLREIHEDLRSAELRAFPGSIGPEQQSPGTGVRKSDSQRREPDAGNETQSLGAESPRAAGLNLQFRRGEAEGIPQEDRWAEKEPPLGTAENRIKEPGTEAKELVAASDEGKEQELPEKLQEEQVSLEEKFEGNEELPREESSPGQVQDIQGEASPQTQQPFSLLRRSVHCYEDSLAAQNCE